MSKYWSHLGWPSPQYTVPAFVLLLFFVFTNEEMKIQTLLLLVSFFRTPPCSPGRWHCWLRWLLSCRVTPQPALDLGTAGFVRSLLDAISSILFTLSSNLVIFKQECCTLALLLCPWWQLLLEPFMKGSPQKVVSGQNSRLLFFPFARKGQPRTLAYHSRLQVLFFVSDLFCSSLSFISYLKLKSAKPCHHQITASHNTFSGFLSCFCILLYATLGQVYLRQHCLKHI